MKRNFIRVSLVLAMLGMMGTAFTFSACSDDDNTEIAELRPEGDKGTDPSADGSAINGIIPAITDVVADEANKTMTIKGANLDRIVKVVVKAVIDSKVGDISYKAGDEVDITSTIVADQSSKTELVLGLMEGQITAYFDALDNTKKVVDGGFGIPVPEIAEFTTDFETKTMTITGKNLKSVVAAKVGKDNIIDKAVEEITDEKMVLPLWEGKIALGYDANNENRVVENDGYTFPVPAITKVTRNEDKMTVEGSNLEYITKLTIDNAEVTLPKIEKEAKSFELDYATGKILAFYFFNGKDDEQNVSNRGLQAIPTELVNLTDKDYHSWVKVDGKFDASVEIDQEEIPCGYEIGKSSGQPYGNGSVKAYEYADLTDCLTLQITVTDGTPRVMMNREGSAADGYEGGTFINMTSDAQFKEVVKNPDGSKTYVVDIAAIVKDYQYAHLNAIKGANWANVTVTSIQVEKVAKKNHVLQISNSEPKGDAYAKQLDLTWDTPLEQGKNYVLEMKAMANTEPFDGEVTNWTAAGATVVPTTGITFGLQVDFQNAANENVSLYGKMGDISTEWKTYQLEFKAEKADIVRARLGLARLNGTMLIDDVKVYEKDDETKLIKIDNSDFELGEDVPAWNQDAFASWQKTDPTKFSWKVIEEPED